MAANPEWPQTRIGSEPESAAQVAASRNGRKSGLAAISDRPQTRIGRDLVSASAQRANWWEIESRLTIPAGIP
jgi:hypothetical protein